MIVYGNGGMFWLDFWYIVFGVVSDGMDIVDKIVVIEIGM